MSLPCIGASEWKKKRDKMLRWEAWKQWARQTGQEIPKDWKNGDPPPVAPPDPNQPPIAPQSAPD